MTVYLEYLNFSRVRGPLPLKNVTLSVLTMIGSTVVDLLSSDRPSFLVIPIKYYFVFITRDKTTVEENT